MNYISLLLSLLSTLHVQSHHKCLDLSQTGNLRILADNKLPSQSGPCLGLSKGVVLGGISRLYEPVCAFAEPSSYEREETDRFRSDLLGDRQCSLLSRI